ncbi:hypothetical protein EG328_005641 [Venturia inaequalis]|uniref:Letm1 RBD domain-containing protein n=1 Tax=Venturia inaequalis TaxID=5025 RepID=A0A8H3ZE57_VENIN|nr:hypothetical protein EG328_005641 [Venturia inaequalis]
MQEHIRRAHPEHYIAKLPATEESFALMVNTPPSERPAQPSQASSSHAPVAPPYGAGFYNEPYDYPPPGRSSDELRRPSLIPATDAAGVLAQLHNQRPEIHWDNEPPDLYSDNETGFNNVNRPRVNFGPSVLEHNFGDDYYPDFGASRRDLMPSSLVRSPPYHRSSTLPPAPRPGKLNRPRKSSITENARRPKHERTKSKGHARRMSHDRKAMSAEPTSALAKIGNRWEDLIEAAASATEEDSRDLTPVRHCYDPFLVNYTDEGMQMPPSPNYRQTRLSSHSSRKPYTPTSNALASQTDKVNASSTSLPAPLDVPERQQGQSTFSYVLKAGKTYVRFYVTGIKNIYYNYKVAKELKTKLEKTQTPQLPPGPDRSNGKDTRGGENAYAKFVLTRAELQFLRRSRFDMSRAPVFALLFAVVGEWLPLFVIFLTPIVPYTCRIPRQVEKTRRALEETRRKSFRGEIDGYIPTPTRRGKNGEGVKSLEECEKGQLMHISRSLGLHSRLWDYTKGFMPGSGILKYRVRKHLDYLAQDDALLVRDGGVQKLNQEEVMLACEQRGIDVLGRREEYLKDVLERWLKGRREGMIFGMLLSRP